MIKAVIFDMDGLLIDSEPFWRRAQTAAFATVGVNLTIDDMRSTMGRRIDEVVEYWYLRKPWKEKSQKDIEALIIDEVIRLVRTERAPKEGVEETLEFFHKKGLPMAVASSSPSELISAVVEALDIRSYFVDFYSAENETYGKPHPGVFISTASRMGVPSQGCLVFEDSPSGVLASKSASMSCVAVPEKADLKHPYIRTADKVLDSLSMFDENIFNELNKF